MIATAKEPEQTVSREEFIRRTIAAGKTEDYAEHLAGVIARLNGKYLCGGVWLSIQQE